MGLLLPFLGCPLVSPPPTPHPPPSPSPRYVGLELSLLDNFLNFVLEIMAFFYVKSPSSMTLAIPPARQINIVGRGLGKSNNLCPLISLRMARLEA